MKHSAISKMHFCLPKCLNPNPMLSSHFTPQVVNIQLLLQVVMQMMNLSRSKDVSEAPP